MMLFHFHPFYESRLVLLSWRIEFPNAQGCDASAALSINSNGSFIVVLQLRTEKKNACFKTGILLTKKDIARCVIKEETI
jgi:hypothetical protein